MRNGHVVTALCSGLEDSTYHPIAGTPSQRWRAARRNARLRWRRCNLTLDMLAQRPGLDPLERAALRLYMTWSGLRCAST